MAVFASRSARCSGCESACALAPEASASIAVLPLIFKRVWIDNVRVHNAEYRQRPRMREDRDYTDQLPYFPDIEGWPINDADPTPLPEP